MLAAVHDPDGVQLRNPRGKFQGLLMVLKTQWSLTKVLWAMSKRVGICSTCVHCVSRTCALVWVCATTNAYAAQRRA